MGLVGTKGRTEGENDALRCARPACHGTKDGKNAGEDCDDSRDLLAEVAVDEGGVECLDRARTVRQRRQREAVDDGGEAQSVRRS